MPRDLHGTDPVLGHSHGNDVKGSTAVADTAVRRAGLTLTGEAIRVADGDPGLVDRAELASVLAALGLKILE